MIANFSFLEQCYQVRNQHLVLMLCKLPQGICGKPYYKPILPTKDHVGNRIANGIEARQHSHPWLALVLRKTDETIYKCGGGLIHWQDGNSSDLVLTAAHCVSEG